MMPQTLAAMRAARSAAPIPRMRIMRSMVCCSALSV